MKVSLFPRLPIPFRPLFFFFFFYQTQWLCTCVWSIDQHPSPLSVHRKNNTDNSYSTTLQNVISAVARATRGLLFQAPNRGCLLTDQINRLPFCLSVEISANYTNHIWIIYLATSSTFWDHDCDICTGTHQMMTQVERASWRLPIARPGWNKLMFLFVLDKLDSRVKSV